MNFLNLVFYVFILLFLAVYYVVPNKYRYIVIFIGSYVFYGYSDPQILIVLIIASLISYAGGWLIQKSNFSKAVYTVFFLLEIVLLGLFKYTEFVISNLKFVLSKINENLVIQAQFRLLMPVGLSFIVFQACTYLSDVYRKRIDVVKNPVKHGAFVAFFPTLLSGPIQKSRSLIPQIENPARFDYERAQKGVLLFIWGLFQKIMVANRLMVISTTVFGDYPNRSSAELLIAAVCFSLYIYADFSSYSDMARGVSKVMGIEVGRNFLNPYLSTTISEFWTRWHVSLNEWFVENIYIPLGGNRKGILRKYFNMMVVFGISGLWHGAHWHFVAWGVINGILAIIGQMTAPAKKKLYAKLKVDENTEGVLFIKRVIVFLLITMTWVSFNSKLLESLEILKKIIRFDFVSIFNPALLNIGGTAVFTFVTFLTVLIFCIVQYSRRDEAAGFIRYKRQPFVIQCLMAAVIICICIFAVCDTDAIVDTQFLYFQF